jgi:hypothetical protein
MKAAGGSASGPAMQLGKIEHDRREPGMNIPDAEPGS